MARKKNTETKTEPIKDDESTFIDEHSSAPIVPKEVSQDQLITVKNGFNGRLVYISPRTQERYVWEEFGDEQEIELRELRNVKSSSKGFFENNWFIFDEDNEWVITYLGLNKYYAHALKPEDFDGLFDKSAEELEEIVTQLSAGQKRSVAYMAREMVNSGEIDSRKKIVMLEKVLGTQLIEK